MAWRPTEYLIEGELDNTVQGKVTGWMQFVPLEKTVIFNLEGNFHRDIRGAKIKIYGDGKTTDLVEASQYMEGFAYHQTGNVGDMTAGLPPYDYVKYPYIEWYSNENGRVVLELEKNQIQVIGKPISPSKSKPISREQQELNMKEFLYGILKNIKK